MIIQRIKTWWQNRIIQRSAITEIEWQEAFKSLPLLSRLNKDEKKKLRIEETIERYRNFVTEFPNTKYKKELGLISDEMEKELQAFNLKKQ